jgi:hypothetical protein
MEEACADARVHMCDCVPIPPRHLLQGSPNYKSDRNPNPVTQRWRRIPTRVYIESRRKRSWTSWTLRPSRPSPLARVARRCARLPHSPSLTPYAHPGVRHTALTGWVARTWLLCVGGRSCSCCIARRRCRPSLSSPALNSSWPVRAPSPLHPSTQHPPSALPPPPLLLSSSSTAVVHTGRGRHARAASVFWLHRTCRCTVRARSKRHRL